MTEISGYLASDVVGATTKRGTLPAVSTEASQIIEAAMKLPDAERAFVAAVLTDSIGDGSTREEIEAAWLAEVKRRRDDLDAGRTQPVPWEDVREKLHSKIRRARERRSA
ncbi:MAG: addiction module protein [Enhygromyxa sp.]